MQYNPHQQSQYKLVSALNPEMVLDCAGNNKVCLYKWHKGGNQRWRILNVGNGKYAFQNVQHSTMLTVPNGSNENGVQLEAHNSHKKPHQLWELIPCNEGQYYGRHAFYLRSHCGKALDVNQGKAQNDQKIIQWDYNGNKNQIWILEPVSFIPQQNVPYKIVSALDEEFVLDASQHPNDMNNLILWKWQNGPNQKFHINLHNGKYHFVNVKNGLSIQSANGSGDNGTRARVSNVGKANHEFWELVPCQHPDFKNRSAFYIRSHSGRVLDVSGGKAQKQVPVIQWDYNGNKNQIWFIEIA